jgi:hypothetical protein
MDGGVAAMVIEENPFGLLIEKIRVFTARCQRPLQTCHNCEVVSNEMIRYDASNPSNPSFYPFPDAIYPCLKISITELEKLLIGYKARQFTPEELVDSIMSSFPPDILVTGYGLWFIGKDGVRGDDSADHYFREGEDDDDLSNFTDTDDEGLDQAERAEARVRNEARIPKHKAYDILCAFRDHNMSLHNLFFELLGQRLGEFPKCISLRFPTNTMTPTNVVSILPCAAHGTLLALTVLDSDGSHVEWRDPDVEEDEDEEDEDDEDEEDEDEDEEDEDEYLINGGTFNEMGCQIVQLFQNHLECFSNVCFLRLYPRVSAKRGEELMEQLLYGCLQNVTVMHGADRHFLKSMEKAGVVVPETITSNYPRIDEFDFEIRDISALIEFMRRVEAGQVSMK